MEHQAAKRVKGTQSLHTCEPVRYPPKRFRSYRAAGVTTLLAKLEGDYSEQLATLEQLVAIADSAETSTSD